LKAFAKRLGVWAVLTWASAWSASSAADIILFDFGLNIDGDTTCNEGLGCDTNGAADLGGIAGVGDSGFNYTTGLGVLSITLTGSGAHYVGLFVDHEIDEPLNTFFNENGNVGGTGAAGQSWEIDEPGYVFGNIFSKLPRRDARQQ